MAQFYDGVTRLWVPDNAKTGVVKPCYYEPQIHDTYQEVADHYGTRRSCRHALTLHATKPRWNRRCSTPSAVS